MSKGVLGGIVAAIAASFLLMSCDAFYSTNLFQQAGLGAKTPDASALGSMTVAQLQAQSQTAPFYADLTANPSLAAAVVANLQAQISAPAATPAGKQEAAALLADVYLKTTAAEQLVTSIVTPILSNPTSLASLNPSTGLDLIKQLLPTGMTQADFTASISALYNANSVYTNLNTSMTGSSYAGSVNAGDVAQSALLAYAVSNIGPSSGVSYPIDPTNAAAVSAGAAALWAALQSNDASGLSLGSITLTSGGPIGNIIGAAGLHL